MKITDVSFVKSAIKVTQYPELKVPEVAFYGRSNSGKSTLINILTRKPGLVKTGSRPGMTRHINFFISAKKLALVDLPGYGYAAVDSAQKQSFTPMVREYFSSRTTLKMVFLLMDVRRSVGEDDKEIVSFLADLGIPTALVATKADKLGQNDLAKNLQKISASLEIPRENIFLVSSKSKRGIHDLEILLGQVLFGDFELQGEAPERQE